MKVALGKAHFRIAIDSPFECVWRWKDTTFISAKRQTLYSVDLDTWTTATWDETTFGREKELSNGVLGAKASQSYFYRGEGFFENSTTQEYIQYIPGFDAIDGLSVVLTGDKMYTSEDTLPPFIYKRVQLPSYQGGLFPIAVTPNRTILRGDRLNLFRTDDLGKTWDTLTNNTSGRDWVRAIDCIDDVRSGRLVFVSRDSAILYSSDDGRTYTDISAGGPTVPINRFFHDNGMVYALTDGQGIWTYDLQSLVGVDESLSSSHFTDHGNSGCEYLIVDREVTIDRAGLKSVTIVNVLGDIVFQGAAERTPLTVQTASWPTGMYFCIARCDSGHAD